ncbi:hypothetical protein FJ364_01355 [Candidatus Dependentiae bacterium]|nr:hypothetical protein [Candidatus Dependentiae bacterium]
MKLYKGFILSIIIISLSNGNATDRCTTPPAANQPIIPPQTPRIGNSHYDKQKATPIISPRGVSLLFTSGAEFYAPPRNAFFVPPLLSKKDTERIIGIICSYDPIDAKSHTNLIQADHLIQSIPGLVPMRNEYKSYKGSMQKINMQPYAGAIIIAVQTQAIETLKYLVNLSQTQNLPLDTVIYFAMHAMMYNASLSIETARSMLSILDPSEEILKKHAPQILQQAAASHYAKGLILNIIKYALNEEDRQSALEIAIQCCSDHEVIYELMLHVPNYALDQYDNNQTNANKKCMIEEVFKTYPHLMVELYI